MKRITKSSTVPEGSLVLKGFKRVDYVDRYQTESMTTETVDEITIKLFTAPGWVDALMRVRNLIVRPFGLKTDTPKTMTGSERLEVGSTAVLFHVIDRNDNEIVIGENDRHLNFRSSVLVMKKRTGSLICLTTVVHFNNWFGRLYFMPVKPFHRLIVRSLLKRIT